MRLPALLSAIAAGGLLALVLIANAYAHAEPSTVMPGDGAVLAASPGQIVIETTQNMARQAGANDIVVVDASGKVETTAEAVVDDTDRRRLTQTVPASLPPGVYTIKWKTLSADDGDAADGTFSFTIDPSKPGTVTVSSAVTTAPNTAVAQPPALQATKPPPPAGGGGSSSNVWTATGIAGALGLIAGIGIALLLIRHSAPTEPG